jgi:hypothetical protein
MLLLVISWLKNPSILFSPSELNPDLMGSTLGKGKGDNLDKEGVMFGFDADAGCALSVFGAAFTDKLNITIRARKFKFLKVEIFVSFLSCVCSFIMGSLR